MLKACDQYSINRSEEKRKRRTHATKELLLARELDNKRRGRRLIEKVVEEHEEMYKYLSIFFVLSTVKGIHEPGGWHPVAPAEYFQESVAKQSFHSVPSDLNDVYDQP